MFEKKYKIIAISASPSKKRNSDTMLDYFILGLKEKSKNNLEVEKFYLNDIEFENYQYENSLGAMENEKDFSELVNKFKESDGIIIATPTYNFSVPAKLKNFIDRIRFIALDLEKKNFLGQPVGKLKKQKIFLLVSGGTPNWTHFFLFFMYPDFWLRAVFFYYGNKKILSFYSGDIKTYQNKKILTKCFKRGQKFAKKVTK